MLKKQTTLTILECFIRGKLPSDITRDTGFINKYVGEQLAILFNASGNETFEQHNYPFVNASVLNFGVGNLAGKMISSIDTHVLSRQIRTAILRYEPRILPATLRVTFISIDKYSKTSLNFMIEGEIGWQKSYISFSLSTHWNTDSGEVLVQPLNSGIAHG